MSGGVNLPDIIDARSISNYIPEGLPALLIKQSPSVGPTVRICAVGDIGLSGRAAATAKQLGAAAIFAEVTDTFKSADIVFGNLESPLAAEVASSGMFAAPSSGANILANAGFTLLHLANNHVGEYGQAGLEATLCAVRQARLTTLGVGDDPVAAKRLVRTEVNGVRIGWLGSGRTLLPQPPSGPRYWEFDENELLDAVREARGSLDVLIVSIHIGLMYIDYPRPDHKLMAERLMAAGADLILMHHAHVLQGVQVTADGSVCCYNLGNFVYDWEEGDVRAPIAIREQNEGAILVFDLDRNGVATAAALPTWMDEACRVRWGIGRRGHDILERLKKISADLETDFSETFERQRAERNAGHIVKVLWFEIKHRNWRRVAASLRRARPEHLFMAWRWLSGSGHATP